MLAPHCPRGSTTVLGLEDWVTLVKQDAFADPVINPKFRAESQTQILNKLYQTLTKG